MGRIATEYDRSRDLTLFKAVGEMQVTDFRDCLEAYYGGEVTRFILWDLTQADLAAFKNRHIKEVAQVIAGISGARRGGRTAFVYDKAFEYGIGRMFQAYSQMEEMPFEVQAFKTIVEARAWLGV